MWPDRESNPGPLTYSSGALPTALRGPAGGMLLKAVAASNIFFLMLLPVSYLGTQRLRCLGGGSLVGVSYLISAGTCIVSHEMRQKRMLYARRDSAIIYFTFKLLGLSDTDEIKYRNACLSVAQNLAKLRL